MKIAVTCECGFQHQLPAETAGKQGKCRQCGRVIVVPGAALSRQEVAQLAKAFSLWREIGANIVTATVALLALVGVVGLAVYDLAKVPYDPKVFPPLERTLIGALAVIVLFLIVVYSEICRCARAWRSWSARWFGVAYVVAAFALGIGAFVGTILAEGSFLHIPIALAGGVVAIFCVAMAFNGAAAVEEFVTLPKWSRDTVVRLMKPAGGVQPWPVRAGQAAEAPRRTELSKQQLDDLARTLRMRGPVVVATGLYQAIAWAFALHVAVAWLTAILAMARMKGPISLGEFLVIVTVVELSIVFVNALAYYGARRCLVWVHTPMMALYAIATLAWAAFVALCWVIAATGNSEETAALRPGVISLIVLMVLASFAVLSLQAMLAASKLARQPAWCRQAVMGEETKKGMKKARKVPGTKYVNTSQYG